MNRAYYATFYGTLALFLHSNVNPKTSKHAGVIAVLDKDFVHTGKLDKRYSKILHKMFDMRQQSDYRELVELTEDDARESVSLAKEYLLGVKKIIGE